MLKSHSSQEQTFDYYASFLRNILDGHPDKERWNWNSKSNGTYFGREKISAMVKTQNGTKSLAGRH